MAPVLKYRDPDDGVFKEFSGPTGPAGPTGPTGPDGGGAANTLMPIGAIMPYAGSVAPTGWHLCDGSAHGSAELQAVIGTATTPNLQARFVRGAGAGGVNVSGGVATVTLTATQTGLVGHNHTGTAASHTHTLNPVSTNTGNMSAGSTHSHSAPGPGKFALQFTTTEKKDGSGGSILHMGGSTANTLASPTMNHNHSVNILPSNSSAASGTPALTAVTAAKATASHDNIPPYYALTYIIFAG